MIPPDTPVAILTNNANHAAWDRKSLTKLNLKRIRVCETLKEALSSLLDGTAELLLIDAASADLDGQTCLKTLRQDSRLFLKPAVMVTAENRLQKVMDAIAAGCNGYVIRPYSLDTFERHLRLAWDSTTQDAIEAQQIETAGELVGQGLFDEAIEELSEIVEEENEAVKYFNLGMDYLHRQKFGKAIIAFNKAVRQNALFAEAYKGLAEAHKGKGNLDNYKLYLEKSAEILALQDRLDELKELFVEILKANPDATNPYNSMGIALRKKGDYAGALHAYSRAVHLTPDDENLHYNIAKAHLFTKGYDQAIHHLEQAVALRESFDEARQLLYRLQNKQYEGITASTRDQQPVSDQGLALDA